MKRFLRVVFCVSLLFAFHFSLSTSAYAQGGVTGRVVDKRTGENIEYANIALLKASDSSLVNGTVSERNGTFSLTAPYGRYILRVTFIGYDAWYYADPVVFNDRRRNVNVGKVELKMTGTMMEAVEISAERSMVGISSTNAW